MRSAAQEAFDTILGRFTRLRAGRPLLSLYKEVGVSQLTMGRFGRGEAVGIDDLVTIEQWCDTQEARQGER